MCLLALVAHNLLRCSTVKFEREQLRLMTYTLRTGERGGAIKQRLEADDRSLRNVVEDLLRQKQRYRRRSTSLWCYLPHRWSRLRRYAVAARARRMSL